MVDQEKALEIIEVAKATGKIRKGANEVTKVLEKGTAKFVVIAGDVSPKEIVMHIPLIAKDKGVPCIEVPTKDELGAAAGLEVGTSAVAVIAEGESKNLIKSFMIEPKKEEKKSEAKEEKAEEPKKEDDKDAKNPEEKKESE